MKLPCFQCKSAPDEANLYCLSFVLSRKIMTIYDDIAGKYRNVTVKDFRKYEKLKYKQNKLELDIDFRKNCKQLCVYPKFLIFKLWNDSNKASIFTNIPLQETTDIAKNLIFNHNPHLNITKKNLKNFSFLLHIKFIFYLTVNFIIKLME